MLRFFIIGFGFACFALTPSWSSEPLRSPVDLELLTSRARVLLVMNQRVRGMGRQDVARLDEQLREIRKQRAIQRSEEQEPAFRSLLSQKVALLLSLYQATGEMEPLNWAAQTIEANLDVFDQSPELRPLKATVLYFQSSAGLVSKDVLQIFESYLRNQKNWPDQLENAWVGLLLGDEAFDRSAWVESLLFYEPLVRSRLRSSQVGELARLRLAIAYRKLSRFSESEEALRVLVFREGDDRVSKAAARELARTVKQWRDRASSVSFYRKTFEQDSIESLKKSDLGRVFLQTLQSELLPHFDDSLKKRVVHVASRVLLEIRGGLSSEALERLIQIMNVVSRFPDVAREIGSSLESEAKRTLPTLRTKFSGSLGLNLTKRLYISRFTLTADPQFRASLASEWLDFCERALETACVLSVWDTLTAQSSVWMTSPKSLQERTRTLRLAALRELARSGRLGNFQEDLAAALEDCLANCRSTSAAVQAGRELAESLARKKNWSEATRVIKMVLQHEPRMTHWIFHQRIQLESGLADRVFFRPESIGVALLDCEAQCENLELSEIKFKAAQRLAQSAVDRDDLVEAGLQFARVEKEAASEVLRHSARDQWLNYLIHARHWEDALRKLWEFPASWRARNEAKVLVREMAKGLLRAGVFEWSKEYLSLLTSAERKRSLDAWLLSLLSEDQPVLSDLELWIGEREMVLECFSRVQPQAAIEVLSRLRVHSVQERVLLQRLRAPLEAPRLERFDLLQGQIRLLRERGDSGQVDAEQGRAINFLILRLTQLLEQRRKQAEVEFELQSLKPMADPDFILPEGWDQAGSPLEPVAWLWSKGNTLGACLELERRRPVLRPEDYWRMRVWWLASLQGAPGARVQSAQVLAELFSLMKGLSGQIPVIGEILQAWKARSGPGGGS